MHAGDYTCSVTNSAGQVNYTAPLTVNCKKSKSKLNKIRDLFKVKLFTVRSETKKKKERKKKRESEREKESKTLNIY